MADEEPRESRPFHATVRQAYALPDRHMLILESYRGDVGKGDALALVVGDARVVVHVRDIAWGSAFNANDPPLTLIVDRIRDVAPDTGAVLEPA